MNKESAKLPDKIRLDSLIFEKGLTTSKSRSRALILSGKVLVNNLPVDKAGTLIHRESQIRIKGDFQKYVSRGGDKLESAINHFEINFENKFCLDIGASTGGFTDCLLQHGAKKVYSLDVGYNQLDYSLRKDERVVVMERCHAKDLKADQLNDAVNFFTVDVSFISVRKILSYIFNVLESPYQGLILVKPQFELEREFIEKGGVVRSLGQQLKAVESVVSYLDKNQHNVLGTVPSGLKGQKKGNQEYFIYFESRHEA